MHLNDIDAVLITHEHADHILGAGILSRKYDIPLYANEKTWAAMEDKIGGVSRKNKRLLPAADFYIDDLEIESYPIPHDAADPVGYCVSYQNKKVSIMTDLGHCSQKILKKVSGSNIVLLESNHDIDMLNAGRYPYYLKRRILSSRGHLSNVDAARAAVSLVELQCTGHHPRAFKQRKQF